MMMTIGLKEMYGAQFPHCSEFDHWMALRGLLCLYLKHANSAGAKQQLSDAIRFVTTYLERNLEAGMKDQPDAPSDLFGHYYNVISLHWVWLNALRNLR